MTYVYPSFMCVSVCGCYHKQHHILVCTTLAIVDCRLHITITKVQYQLFFNFT